MTHLKQINMMIDQALRKKLKEYVYQQIVMNTKKYVEIVTPIKLKEDELKALVSKYPALKDAEIENSVDSSIIGGFILKFGSTIFDASITGSINHYVEKLYEHC